MIAILGASGAVGAAAAKALRCLAGWPVRLGARDPDPLGDLADQLGGEVDVVPVDLAEAGALAAFCRGAEVVLNCAGPSYRVLDRVADAALAAGAGYVDVAGDGPTGRRLAPRELAGSGQVAVLSAGVLPGLSGLLPRWFAGQTVGTPVRLAAYCGGLERCTATAAADMALSLPSAAPRAADRLADHGQPLAAWRGGRRSAGVLRAGARAEVPHFPGMPFRQPFLTFEAGRLAVALRVSELDWYHVYPGERVRRVLTAAAGMDLSDQVRFAGFVQRLRTAADVDLVGQQSYYRLVFRLGTCSHRHDLVVDLPDSYQVTGWVGAWTVRAVLGGEISPGTHFACEVLDPNRTVQALHASGLVRSLRSLDGVPESTQPLVEGVL